MPIFERKNMPTIYAIGETIYDIIFQDSVPVAAKAGGSMLNTAVSLGRLGMPIRFLSEYGNDHAGNVINEFLTSNGVDTTFNYRYDKGKTPIALAFLDSEHNASYSFYKLYPEERLSLQIPEFKPGDIVLFGAFYSLLPEVRKQVLSFVESAKEVGAFILYDPNIRSPHKNEIAALRELVYENFALADMVRGSNEDFNTMFDVDNAEDAYNIVKEHGCDTLVYTKSDIEVKTFFKDQVFTIPVPRIKTLSTIGAGDSFNAGLIYEIFNHGITLKNLSEFDEESMRKLISTAISFGSHVCTHYDNYISVDFALKLK